MSFVVKIIDSSDNDLWDEYVLGHPESTLYHLSAWQNIIKKTYGHKTYYLAAFNDDSAHYTRNTRRKEIKATNNTSKGQNNAVNFNKIVGILPLVHLKNFIFGCSLISLPFFDMGGILADNEKVEETLLLKARKIAKQLKTSKIELRHLELPVYFKNSESNRSKDELSYTSKQHKVRMLLALPDSSNALMKSFKAKLRSQIKKPIKEGLECKIGGPELLGDFYNVFLVNMRDLGSPIHSLKLMKNVFKAFPNSAKIVVVYKSDEPLASSIVVGFKDVLENPWASALRKYSRLSPNMLLYWTMLEYACDNGFKYFDFGRSTRDEGTYKFKEQWGAKPKPLYWQYLSLNGRPINEASFERPKFNMAVKYWQKLPIAVTKVIGPMIRKHIAL
jgi:FemAB-related protein (PEP-CTERM system-associated)